MKSEKKDTNEKNEKHEKNEAADSAGAQDDAQPGKAKTQDSNNPRTRNQAEQVKVWEEEGGSPPEQISATNSVKPKTESKTGAMGGAKD